MTNFLIFAITKDDFMMEKLNRISKSLSYWLRHNPGQIGIELTKDGWTDVEILINKVRGRVDINFDDLKYVVDNNDKKRFSFNEDFTLIKANQGHSISVDLELTEVRPPEILYHGTSKSVLPLIAREGIKKMNRHHCHLSSDIETAKNVANRRKGEIVVLEIYALHMMADGYKIFISDNGVYLVDEVPLKYIKGYGPK